MMDLNERSWFYRIQAAKCEGAGSLDLATYWRGIADAIDDHIKRCEESGGWNFR